MKTKAASFRQILFCFFFCFLCLSLFSILGSTPFSAYAGRFWFYEYQTPSRKTVFGSPMEKFRVSTQDRRWLVYEFHNDPSYSQLNALRELSGFKKLTVLFHRPLVMALTPHYLDFIKSRSESGLETELKFVGKYPSDQEVEFLKVLCSLGSKVFFISRILPNPHEAQRLQSLQGCLDLQVMRGRYFVGADLHLLKNLTGIPIGLIADHFPNAAAVDLLNRVENPFSLWIWGLLPTKNQLLNLSAARTLKSFTLEASQYPSPRQYDDFYDFQRKGLLFAIRWRYANPRQLDYEAWDRLSLSHLQIPWYIVQDPYHERKLRNLATDVIVETFSFENTRLELYPSF